MFHRRRCGPVRHQVSILSTRPCLAGWHLQLPSVRMRPRWRGMGKKNTKPADGYSLVFLFKCQIIAPPRETLPFPWLFSDPGANSLPFPVETSFLCADPCDAAAAPLCVARRLCGESHGGASVRRAAGCGGAHGARESASHQQHSHTSDLCSPPPHLLSSSSSLLSLFPTFSSPTTTSSAAEVPAPAPSVTPPRSGFDLSSTLRGALVVHTVLGANQRRWWDFWGTFWEQQWNTTITLVFVRCVMQFCFIFLILGVH